MSSKERDDDTYDELDDPNTGDLESVFGSRPSRPARPSQPPPESSDEDDWGDPTADSAFDDGEATDFDAAGQDEQEYQEYDEAAEAGGEGLEQADWDDQGWDEEPAADDQGWDEDQSYDEEAYDEQAYDEQAYDEQDEGGYDQSEQELAGGADEDQAASGDFYGGTFAPGQLSADIDDEGEAPLDRNFAPGALGEDAGAASDGTDDVDYAVGGEFASGDLSQEFSATADDDADPYTPLPADAGRQVDDEEVAGDDAEVPAGADGQTSAAEEELLFEATGASDEDSEQFESGPEFSEEGRRNWGGQLMTPDEIGIPTGQEAHLVEDDFGLDSDQELEVIGDDGEAVPAAADDEDFELALDEDVYEQAAAEVLAAGDGDAEATLGDDDDEFFLLDEQEGELVAEEVPEYPVEEGWEPVDESDSWQDEPQQDYEDYSVTGTEQPYETPIGAAASGGEELYYDETPPAPVVIAPQRRGRVLRLVASLAAALIVVGAGAVVVLRPEWFGLTFEPQLVERVQVTRPSVDLRVPTPPMPVAQPVAPEPVTPEPVEPEPVAPQPVEPEPVTPEPVEPEPVEPQPPVEIGQNEPAPVEPAPDLPEYLPVGSELWIGQFGQRRPRAEWSSVPPGASAFAQLENGNFFIGKVKAVAADALVLRLTDGEVTLHRDEVQALTTLDSTEYAELQKATAGFLRLSNNNRLVGTILESVEDDNYVLQMRSDRIVVPRAAVQTFVQQVDGGDLRFGDEEDSWLQELAARQLKAMATGEEGGPEGVAPRSGQARPGLPVPVAPQRRSPVERTPPRDR